MFTGLIEEIGFIKKIDRIAGGGSRITIQADKILSDLKKRRFITENKRSTTFYPKGLTFFWFSV